SPAPSARRAWSLASRPSASLTISATLRGWDERGATRRRRRRVRSRPPMTPSRTVVSIMTGPPLGKAPPPVGVIGREGAPGFSRQMGGSAGGSPGGDGEPAKFSGLPMRASRPRKSDRDGYDRSRQDGANMPTLTHASEPRPVATTLVAACRALARLGIVRDRHRDHCVARVGVVGPTRATSTGTGTQLERRTDALLARDGLRIRARRASECIAPGAPEDIRVVLQ